MHNNLIQMNIIFVFFFEGEILWDPATKEEKNKLTFLAFAREMNDDFSDDEFHRYVSLTVIFGVVSKIENARLF